MTNILPVPENAVMAMMERRTAVWRRRFALLPLVPLAPWAFAFVVLMVRPQAPALPWHQRGTAIAALPVLAVCQVGYWAAMAVWLGLI